MREHIGRSRPAEGVFIFRGQPTIVFLTVCAERREPALANSRVHGALIDAWRVANAWHVGYYVVMVVIAVAMIWPETRKIGALDKSLR